MKTIKEIYNNGLTLILESASSNDGIILGYVINRYEDGLRYYLSSPLNLTEADEHLEFFQNVYKK